MTRRNRCTALLLATLVALPGARVSGQDVRPGVAVLPFENGGSYGRDREDYEGLRRAIAAMLIGELGQDPRLRLVERSESQRLLDEQSLGTSGRIDLETAARVGRMVGARYMITGTFIDLYGEFRLDARLIDVETGEILSSVRSDPKLHDFKDLSRQVQSLSTQITAQTRLPALPPAPPTVIATSQTIPTEAATLYGRALRYEDLGQKDRAIEFYERALAVFPDFIQAKEGLRKLREK